MGGPLSLTAAGTYTDRVTAAASLHGARLATDAPDSPHLLAPKMAGEVYVGVSEIDPYLAEGETERLDARIQTGRRHERHGRNPTPVCSTASPFPACRSTTGRRPEHHWERILGLFSRNLPH